MQPAEELGKAQQPEHLDATNHLCCRFEIWIIAKGLEQVVPRECADKVNVEEHRLKVVQSDAAWINNDYVFLLVNIRRSVLCQIGLSFCYHRSYPRKMDLSCFQNRLQYVSKYASHSAERKCTAMSMMKSKSVMRFGISRLSSCRRNQFTCH